jgi:hypothetical protein
VSADSLEMAKDEQTKRHDKRHHKQNAIDDNNVDDDCSHEECLLHRSEVSHAEEAVVDEEHYRFIEQNSKPDAFVS